MTFYAEQTDRGSGHGGGSVAATRRRRASRCSDRTGRPLDLRQKATIEVAPGSIIRCRDERRWRIRPGPSGAEPIRGVIDTDRHADLLLHGGAVYTVDAARSRAQAVAVRKGEIVRVGTDAEVAELAGPRTKRIALEGRMLLPGFQDAHIHASAGGLERLRCDLSGAHSLEAYLDLVRRYAEQRPDEPWILGGGWAIDVFPGGVPTERCWMPWSPIGRCSCRTGTTTPRG